MAKGTVKQQPRLQSITSAVFPPACLTEPAQRRVGRHSLVPRSPAHLTKLATCTRTATRLVLNDKRLELNDKRLVLKDKRLVLNDTRMCHKALAPEGGTYTGFQHRRARCS